MKTDEPAVLTWMIALAPRPRADLIGSHWWREYVTDAWRAANEAWERDVENVALGYTTEMREYAEHTPRPRLKDFLTHLSDGRYAPDRLAEEPYPHSA